MKRLFLNYIFIYEKNFLFFLIGSFFYFCIAATIRPSIPEILKKSDAVVLARVVKIEKLDARSKVVFLSNNMKFFYKKVGEKIEINFEKILISKDRYFFFLRDEPFF